MVSQLEVDDETGNQILMLRPGEAVEAIGCERECVTTGAKGRDAIGNYVVPSCNGVCIAALCRP